MVGQGRTSGETAQAASDAAQSSPQFGRKKEHPPDSVEQASICKNRTLENDRKQRTMEQTGTSARKETLQPVALLTDDGPAMPLIRAGASMMPDMKFGWKPEVKTTHPPIPLYFDFVEHKMHPYRFGENPDTSDIVVYQEKRPQDSYKMHKRYANSQLKNGTMSYKFNFPKNHEGGKFNDDGILEQIFGSRSMERSADDPDDFVGMNPECEQLNRALPPEEEYRYLLFDADFESGNLDMVIKTHPMGAYDVFLRPDTNTTGYFQWFYFRVKNRNKGTKIRINIVNMTKRNSLYQQGMPIQVLSQKKTREQGATWGFGGSNIRYGLSKLMQQEPGVAGESERPRRRVYYQLGWDYTFEYDNDEVFFAYSLPYTFSMVTNLISQIQDSQDRLLAEYRSKQKEESYHDPTVNENSFKIVETSSLATTLAGMEVPMLTITDFSHTRGEELRKKVIVITGRVHPGETNASWIVHGIIKFLLSKDKVANELRKRVIFKIIPMINADGVTIGNTRCSFIGRDVNRLFGHPNQKLTPEPFYLRALVKELQKNDKHKVQAYLDVHAHSGRKSIFMYGPYFPLHSSKYLKIRALPKLVSERTEMFRFFSCKFKIEKYKENCARIAIWRDFNITNCYTIETSALGFLNRDRETIHFSTGLLQEFGECMVHSTFEYHLIQEEDRRLKVALAKKLKAQRKTKRQTIAEILGGVGGSAKKTTKRKEKNANNLEENSENDGISGAESHRQSADEADMQRYNQDNNFQNDQEGGIVDNVEYQHNPQCETKFGENPNEADNPQQEPIVQSQEQPKAPLHKIGIMNVQNEASDDSMDSRAFAGSSSSEDGLVTTPMSQLHQDQPQWKYARLDSKYSQLPQTGRAPGTKEGLTQMQQLLQRKKGLDIIDGEELFHLLYNPYCQDWKSKRQEYVKYEQLQKNRKKSTGRGWARPASTSNVGAASNAKGAIAGGGTGSKLQDVRQRQRDQYYMKEVRTFDEVFKAIKTKVKEHEAQRAVGKGGHYHNQHRKQSEEAGNEYDDEDDDFDEDLQPLDDEYGNEDDFPDDGEEELLDDQDIDDHDREVLNDRILGIINVFSHMVQSSNSQTQLSSKQLKLLQELRQQSLSIEKTVNPGKQSDTVANRIEGTSHYHCKREDHALKKAASRENFDDLPPRKAIGGNPLGAIGLLNSSNSNGDLHCSAVQRKPLVHSAKKKRTYPEIVFGITPIATYSQIQSQIQKPVYNVYNLGAPSGSLVLHNPAKAAPQQLTTKPSKRASYSKSGTDHSIVFGGAEEYYSRQVAEKNDKQDKHNPTFTPVSAMLTEKCLASQKHRMALNKPVRDVKLEVQGSQQLTGQLNSSQNLLVSSQIPAMLRPAYMSCNQKTASQLTGGQDQPGATAGSQATNSAVRQQCRTSNNNAVGSNQFYSNQNPTKPGTAGFKRIQSAGKYGHQKNFVSGLQKKNHQYTPQWQLEKQPDRNSSFVQDMNLSIGGRRLKTAEKGRRKHDDLFDRYHDLNERLISTTQQKEFYQRQSQEAQQQREKDLRTVHKHLSGIPSGEQELHMSRTPTPLVSKFNQATASGSKQRQAVDPNTLLTEKPKRISMINPNTVQSQIHFSNQIWNQTAATAQQHSCNTNSPPQSRPAQQEQAQRDYNVVQGTNFIVAQPQGAADGYQSPQKQQTRQCAARVGGNSRPLTSNGPRPGAQPLAQSHTFQRNQQVALSTTLKPSLTSSHEHLVGGQQIANKQQQTIYIQHQHLQRDSGTWEIQNQPHHHLTMSNQQQAMAKTSNVKGIVVMSQSRPKQQSVHRQASGYTPNEKKKTQKYSGMLRTRATSSYGTEAKKKRKVHVQVAKSRQQLLQESINSQAGRRLDTAHIGDSVTDAGPADFAASGGSQIHRQAQQRQKYQNHKSGNSKTKKNEIRPRQNESQHSLVRVPDFEIEQMK